MAPSPPPAYLLLQAAAPVPSLGHQEQPCAVTAAIQVGLSGPSELLQLLDGEAGLLQGLPQEFLIRGQSREPLVPHHEEGGLEAPAEHQMAPGPGQAPEAAQGGGQAASGHRQELEPAAGGRTAGSRGRACRTSRLRLRVTALPARSAFSATCL